MLDLVTQGPTLLVGRNYRCSVGNHYIRSTDSDLLLHYSQLMDVPFKLTHAQAFTITFLKDLLNAINNGISFNRFQAIYLEKTTDRHYERERQFWNDVKRKQVETQINIEAAEKVL